MASQTSSSKAFMEAVKSRRTYYSINNQPPVSDERILELVHDAILHVPSTFNSQSTRLVVLLKKEHERFWDLVKEVLKPQLTEAQYAATEQKLDGFKAGYGTILFLESPHPIHDMQSRFPTYADRFPRWSEHTSAMHQYVLWTALEADGCGASLQHYNPIVDAAAQTAWNIPAEWNLKAQLVFGGRAGEPGEKTFQPVEERVFVHGV